MIGLCGTDPYNIMKNQMRVDATLRFDLEGDLKGNQGETN